jgi:hypothetical protein
MGEDSVTRNVGVEFFECCERLVANVAAQKSHLEYIGKAQ